MSMERRRGVKHFLVPFDRSDSSGNFSLGSLTEGRYDLIGRCITAAFFYSCGVRCDVATSLVLGPSSVDGSRKSVRIDGGSARHLRPDERSACSLLQRALGGIAPEKATSQAQQVHRRVPNMRRSDESSQRCLAGWSVLPHTFAQELQAVIDALRTRSESQSDTVPSSGSDGGGPIAAPASVCVLYLMEDGAPLHQLLRREGGGGSDLQHQQLTHATQFLVLLGDDRGLSMEHEATLYRILFGSDCSNCNSGAAAAVDVSDGRTLLPGVVFHRCRIGDRPLLASQCILLTLHTLETELTN